MTNLTEFPIPTEVLDPANYPEFKGETGNPGPEIELQTSATHVQWRVVGDESWTDLIALSEITGPEGDPGPSVTVVDALNSTSSTDALSAAQGKALNDAKLAASGGTLTNVKETIYYQEATANITIDWANGDVQYIYVNPAGASIQITLPADPGAISKAGILFVKNNTGKAHTWNTSPAIRFADQADADTVPTPAAVGYYTRYTCQWNDYDSAWWVTTAGRNTA